MRPFLVYLTIGALLWCPLDCSARRVAAQALRSHTQTPCCEKCRERTQSELPDAEIPAAPAPSEDGKSCVCEGVVFVAETPTDQHAEQASLPIPWDADQIVTVSSAVQASMISLGDLHRSSARGHAMRIALGSLLL